MECGGPRVSEQQSAALRRECWRALDLLSGLGKSLPERNLWIPWAARLPPTLTLYGLCRLLFSFLFFDRFLSASACPPTWMFLSMCTVLLESKPNISSNVSFEWS